MRSDEAPDRLLALLDQAGVDVRRPTADDVERTWAVMRGFAAEPVEDLRDDSPHNDGVLAQYGTYGSRRTYVLDMTRQFTFHDEDGDYSHMAQLSCAFAFKATRTLRKLEDANLWSFDLSLEDFFDRALAMPGFVAVREGALTPSSLDVGYDEV